MSTKNTLSGVFCLYGCIIYMCKIQVSFTGRNTSSRLRLDSQAIQTVRKTNKKDKTFTYTFPCYSGVMKFFEI